MLPLPCFMLGYCTFPLICMQFAMMASKNNFLLIWRWNLFSLPLFTVSHMSCGKHRPGCRASVFSQQPLSCDWWNLRGNKCSSVAGTLRLRHGALQLLCGCHEPLVVLCATCSQKIYNCSMFYAWSHCTCCTLGVSESPPCCRHVWNIVFLFTDGSFFFPGNSQISSCTFQVFDLKAPVTFFTMTSESIFALGFHFYEAIKHEKVQNGFTLVIGTCVGSTATFALFDRKRGNIWRKQQESCMFQE